VASFSAPSFGIFCRFIDLMPPSCFSQSFMELLVSFSVATSHAYSPLLSSELCRFSSSTVSAMIHSSFPQLLNYLNATS
jgi:hypothetical protein